MSMTAPSEASLKGIPIREGLFTLPDESHEKAHLIGSRCPLCGQISFPRRSICAKCLSPDLEETPLSGKGRIYTYTVIGYPAPGLEAPYAVAYIDLPEGVRVFSILTGWSRQTLEPGTEVELVIDKFREDEEGAAILTYKFRPVRPQGKIP
ncbi:MAG: Zn-ribbon domain-containing OB-fold protein [Pseudomonadota bacterium]